MLSRRQALKMMGFAAFAPAGFAAASKRKPNVIVVLSDDAGYADFGFTGCQDTPTPNLDSLSRQGTTCRQGYVTASVCAPSRAGLITGRYQQRFGHECNGPNAPVEGYSMDDMGLDPAEKTIGARMQSQGYKTLAVGKWHLGYQEQFHPCNRGFDEFYGFLSGARHYFTNKDVDETHALRTCDEKIDEEKIRYMTRDLTDASMKFIEKNKDQPFFIYLCYNAVHTPMEAPDHLIDKYRKIDPKRRRIHNAMTESLDTNVGRLQDKLNKLGLDDNTLLFFVNDNGGATNNGSRNGKLRGMKGSKWEGGIRVPFIVKWPGEIPAGKDYNYPVSTLDIMPTSLAAAGADKKQINSGKPLDGVNLLPYLQGKNKNRPHETLFWRRAVAGAVRKGDWKLIKAGDNPLLLFNLAEDESETKNLAKKHPEKVKELLKEYKNWEKQLQEPKWREGKKWERNQILKHRMEVDTREKERKYP
ncbi:sulfatase [Sedimentisphaera salicampi]|uniref:Arylsulfatase n=1 Tax=Sedimentisphaera salicampi TaxID=1941349 RepID=A0A1W6LPY1_9BACT|nr:sulfatase [Sedimentisphaera salicampi]ARN57840.1 Arylsulfatase precursor [Sedimentisphaera salicampi]